MNFNQLISFDSDSKKCEWLKGLFLIKLRKTTGDFNKPGDAAISASFKSDFIQPSMI